MPRRTRRPTTQCNFDASFTGGVGVSKRLPVFAGSLFFWSFRMRALIVIACATLPLAACGGGNQADNTVNVDQSLSADNIVSNDVTAIDAVTAADANMAADVNYIPEADNRTNGG